MPTEEFYGQANSNTQKGEYNTIAFVVTQLLNRIATVALVQVVKVYNDGGVEPVGLVDVQPMVHQLTGNGEPVPHGVIYGVPYMRLQGGTNAVILDPQVGDIGACGFCSRDISKVRVTKAPAPPGTFRKYDWADGLYFGGFLNATPVQYVRFTADGIEVVSPSKVTIRAPSIELDGPVTTTSTIDADGDVTGAGISLQNHVHGGVTPGGGNTAPPNP